MLLLGINFEIKFMEKVERLIRSINSLMIIIGLLLLTVLGLGAWILVRGNNSRSIPVADSTSLLQTSLDAEIQSLDKEEGMWLPPSDDELKKQVNAELIQYGKELIANTSKYLGPKGSIAAITNGMNCQNCHLKAGTQPWGNNYAAVASTYPKYRGRSGTMEDVYKRVSDCFERSLNGSAPAKGSREMEAIVAYIQFLGSNVQKGEKPKGTGIYELAFLDRAADPEKGKIAYQSKCVSCHREDGTGVLAADGKSYTYPPLWGKNSFNHGAGLYRLSRFAGYIKANMPQGATYLRPQLTDEEAWDIAAYVNSLPRPSKDLSQDWPKIAEKNIDHPFGPYADAFSEKQHKYGPFQPIKDAKKAMEKK